MDMPIKTPARPIRTSEAAMRTETIVMLSKSMIRTYRAKVAAARFLSHFWIDVKVKTPESPGNLLQRRMGLYGRLITPGGKIVAPEETTAKSNPANHSLRFALSFAKYSLLLVAGMIAATVQISQDRAQLKIQMPSFRPPAPAAEDNFRNPPTKGGEAGIVGATNEKIPVVRLKGIAIESKKDTAQTSQPPALAARENAAMLMMNALGIKPSAEEIAANAKEIMDGNPVGAYPDRVPAALIEAACKKIGAQMQASLFFRVSADGKAVSFWGPGQGIKALSVENGAQAAEQKPEQQKAAADTTAPKIRKYSIKIDKTGSELELVNKMCMKYGRNMPKEAKEELASHIAGTFMFEETDVLILPDSASVFFFGKPGARISYAEPRGKTILYGVTVLGKDGKPLIMDGFEVSVEPQFTPIAVPEESDTLSTGKNSGAPDSTKAK